MKRKIFCLVLSLAMLLTMNTTAFAASVADDGVDDEGYTVADVALVTQVDGSLFDDTEIITLDIDELLSHSTNVTYSGSSYSGSYTSAKYDAGLLGYKYTISFDWVASVNSSGDYIFKDNTLLNAKITTHTNHLILAFTWSYYTYSLDRNVCIIASDGKSVTFETNYRFTVNEKETAISHTFVQENAKTIYLNNLL